MMPCLITMYEKSGYFNLHLQSGKIINDEIRVVGFNKTGLPPKSKKVILNKDFTYKNKDGDVVIYGFNEKVDLVSFQFELTFFDDEILPLNSRILIFNVSKTRGTLSSFIYGFDQKMWTEVIVE